MIKGVNKTIIEINEYDSKMFEKAILFIKPSARNYSSVGLKNEATKYLKKLEENNKDILSFKAKKPRKNRKKRLIIGASILLALGTLIATICFLI